MLKRIMVFILSFVFICGLVMGGSACNSDTADDQILKIFHAGSLSVPFAELESVFEETHPNVDVLLESAGSAATIRKVTELGKTCDIIGSADYTLIPQMMYDEYADWHIRFARNEMVLGYRDGAPYASDLADGTKTWYEVFLGGEVTYGHSDPDQDPCGYRALLVCQLAQKYYYDDAADFGLTPDADANGLYNALIKGTDMDQGRQSIDQEMVRPKETDLIALMEAGTLDYMFQYKSVCVQHDIDYIELDGAINLSMTGEMPDSTSGKPYEGAEGFYQEASVAIQKTPTETQTIIGKPIVYGITVPKVSENKVLAMEFLALLLSEEGCEILTGVCGQPSIIPGLIDYPENMPMPLTVIV